MFQRYPLCGAIGFGAACLTASGALAQDTDGVVLVFGIEQSLEWSDNLGLTVPSEGSSTIAATTLSFGLSSETALDRIEFTGSGAFLIENTPETDGTEADFARPELGFSYTREVPNALFGLDLRYVSDDVDRLTDDLTEANAIGTQTEYGVALRFETGRTATVGFFAAAAYDVVKYEDTVDPDLVDTRTTSVSAGSRLRFSEVLTGTLTVGFVSEDEDGAADTTDTLSASFGLDYALANGSATLVFTQSDEADGEDRSTLEIGRAFDLPTGSFAARLGVTHSDLGETDLIGGLDWERTLPDGAVSLVLEQSSSYDGFTDETTVETDVAFAWRRDISASASILLDLSWARSDSPSELVEEAEIGATYSYALNADWRLNSGVRYQVRDDIDGRAESPSAVIAIGRSFDFLR